MTVIEKLMATVIAQQHTIEGGPDQQIEKMPSLTKPIP